MKFAQITGYIADRFGPVCLACHLTAALTWLLVCLPPQDYVVHFCLQREENLTRRAKKHLALSCCSLSLLLGVGQSYGQL